MATLKVRELVLGEGLPKICIPLVSTTQEDLLQEVQLVRELPCQLVEWRADYLINALEGQGVQQKGERVLQVLGHLRMQLDLPLIFTIRTSKEGGEVRLSQKDYYRINEMVVDSGLVDLIDIETFESPNIVDEEAIKSFIERAHKSHVRVILSNHDFEQTPDMEEMLARFFVMQELGADVFKLAVMPKSEKDVANLLEVTALMRDFYAEKPLITVAMGQMGLTARICGGKFGSAITFAAGKKASAPGQVDAVTLDSFISRYY